MDLDFDLTIEQKDTFTVVTIKGEIDIHTCPELSKMLQTVMSHGDKKIVLNFENVQYIDSTGLGSIAVCAKSLQPNDGHIYVISAKPQIKKIFEISGLSKKNIHLFETEDDVLALSS